MENGAEILKNGEVAQPEGAEKPEGEVAQPEALDMSDGEFQGYIKNLKNGDMPKREEPKQADEKEEAPFKSFATEEEFQTFMNKTVGDRLKKSKEDAAKYADIVRRAKSIYGDDEQAVEKLFSGAEAAAAEEEGISQEEYKAQKELERDAMAWRHSVQKEKDEQEAIRQKQDEWRKEEEDLKAVIPDFDFMRAMQNENFKNAVLNDGMSLASAYIKTQKSFVPEPKRKGVFEVGAGSQSGKAPGKVSPAEMSEADFSSYINKIRDRG